MAETDAMQAGRTGKVARNRAGSGALPGVSVTTSDVTLRGRGARDDKMPAQQAWAGRKVRPSRIREAALDPLRRRYMLTPPFRPPQGDVQLTLTREHSPHLLH